MGRMLFVHQDCIAVVAATIAPWSPGRVVPLVSSGEVPTGSDCPGADPSRFTIGSPSRMRHPPCGTRPPSARPHNGPVSAAAQTLDEIAQGGI